MRNNSRKRSRVPGYNGSMIGRIGGAAAGVILLLSTALAQTAAGPYPSDAVFARLQKAFESKDFDGYAAAFAEPLRQQERLSVASFGESWKMGKVLFRPAGRVKDRDGRERVYVQVFYQKTGSIGVLTGNVTRLNLVKFTQALFHNPVKKTGLIR